MSGTTTGQLHELKAKDIKVKSSLGCLAPAPAFRPGSIHTALTGLIVNALFMSTDRETDGKTDAKKAPKDKRSQPIKHSAAPAKSLFLSPSLSLSLSLSLPLSLSPSLLLSLSELDNHFAFALAETVRRTNRQLPRCSLR